MMAAVISPVKNRGRTERNATIEEIICSISDKTNQINKVASALEENENKSPYYAIESNFEQWNETALGFVGEWKKEVAESVLREDEQYNDHATAVSVVLHRLFDGVEYKKLIAVILISILTFFFVFSILTTINHTVTGLAIFQASFYATLNFSRILLVIWLCGITMNVLLRESWRSDRHPFQQTMLLTAAFLVLYEAYMVISMVFEH